MSLNELSTRELTDLKETIKGLLMYSDSAIIKNNFINSFYRCSTEGRLKGNYTLFGAKTFRPTSSNP